MNENHGASFCQGRKKICVEEKYTLKSKNKVNKSGTQMKPATLHIRKLD